MVRSYYVPLLADQAKAKGAYGAKRCLLVLCGILELSDGVLHVLCHEGSSSHMSELSVLDLWVCSDATPVNVGQYSASLVHELQDMDWENLAAQGELMENRV